MEENQKKRFYECRFFKFAHKIFNVVLVCSFLGLTLSVLSFFCDLSLPVPLRMREQITKIAQNFGVKIEADEIRLSLNGRLDFVGLKVSYANSSTPLFTAKDLRADFEIFDLLRGKLGVRALYLQGGDVYSGFGENSKLPVFENISLNAFNDRGFCKVTFANLYFETLCVSLSGKVEYDFLMELLYTESDFSYKDWDDICEAIHSSKQYLKSFNYPSVNVEFDVKKDFVQTFVKANSSKFSFKVADKNLKFSDFTSYVFYENSRKKHFASAEILTSGADFEDGVLAGSCKGIVEFDFNSMRFLKIRGSLSKLNVYGAEIDYVDILRDDMAFSDVKKLKASMLLDGVKSFWKIGGGQFCADFSGSLEDFKVRLMGNFLPEPILKCSLIPKLEELTWFKFSKSGLNLDGDVCIKFDENLKNPSLKCDVFLDVQNALLFGVDAKSLVGEISFNSDSGDFWARGAKAISNEGWSVGADIYQNLKTFEYKFMLSGSLRPSAINHFMEDWWVDVFKDFKFNKEFPKTDIIVYGTWGDPEIMDVYGEVSLQNAYSCDVLFDEASLIVWVNPSRISIYDLYVRNANRVLIGALNWVYYSNRLDSYNENRIYVKSTLNRAELLAIGGRDVKEALEVLDFDGAPKISLNLLMKNPEREKNAPDIMNLDYECAGNTRAGQFELQDLKFKSYIYGEDIYLSGMDFGIADGSGKGNVFVGVKDGKDYFDADLKIENANQQKFIDVLLNLSKSSDGKDDKKPNDSDFENSKYGKINAEAKISGYSDFVETFKGSGNLFLENPKLTTINLFGLFSRLTSVLRLPVGSFELSKAESPFKIENAQISFDDIKITGPAAKIIGKARYDFQNDNVNATLIFSPFSEVKTPLVSQIMSVVNPISSLAEIELNGSFENPDISINLRPLNVFKSDQSIMEKFEKKMESVEPDKKSN